MTGFEVAPQLSTVLIKYQSVRYCISSIQNGSGYANRTWNGFSGSLAANILQNIFDIKSVSAQHIVAKETWNILLRLGRFTSTYPFNIRKHIRSIPGIYDIPCNSYGKQLKTCQMHIKSYSCHTGMYLCPLRHIYIYIYIYITVLLLHHST